MICGYKSNVLCHTGAWLKSRAPISIFLVTNSYENIIIIR